MKNSNHCVLFLDSDHFVKVGKQNRRIHILREKLKKECIVSSTLVSQVKGLHVLAFVVRHIHGGGNVSAVWINLLDYGTSLSKVL